MTACFWSLLVTWMARGLAASWTGDGQGEHAGRVVGGDVLGVQGLAEEDLPGEGTVGSFGDDHLGAVGLDRGALGADGQDVLLDGQVDGSGIDPGQAAEE